MRQLITILLLFCSSVSFGKNYYFSSSGNDGFTSTQAQSPGTPWQSITKLNAFTGLASGDSVLFNRGESFYGGIVITKPGVYYGSYGTGAKPIITGFTIITGWTNEGNGIYSKVITAAAQTNMVLLDGVQRAIGRFPDAGYLTYESFSDSTSITDLTLGTSINWTGAEVAIRKNDWTIDRCLITNHTGNTLTFTNKNSNQFSTANFGYFIQNDLKTLTSYGEWYHNTTTGKFYMYFGTGVDPNLHTVQVATVNNLVFANGSDKDNITLDNLAFTGSISNGINFQYSQDNCRVVNNSISYIGAIGVNFLTYCTADTISNNDISFCNKNAINGNGSLSTIITGNRLSYNGEVAGQSLGAQGGYEGIYFTGGGSKVMYNSVRRSGYNGITLRYAGGATIQYNFIDSACTLMDDGGGIYMSNPNASGRLIDHNIIINTVGNSAGTADNIPLSAGIYLDEVSSNVTVTNNAIAHTPYAAFKLHKANNNIITDNLAFNNLYGIDLEDYVGNYIRSNSLRRNQFVAKRTSQAAMNYITVSNDIPSFGIADSNFYMRPLDDNLVFKLKQPSLGSTAVTRSLSGWQAFTGQDQHSKKTPVAINDTNKLRFEYNFSDTSRIVTFQDSSYIDADSTVYNNAVSIPRYGARILFYNGAAPSINIPPAAHAGLDIYLILPSSAASITGTGSDSDGSIVSFQWKEGATVLSSTAMLNLTGLTVGEHTYTLTVTDDDGATGSDTMKIFVSATPSPQGLKLWRYKIF